MNQIIIIIGLPGSGKTTLSQTYVGYRIFDDFVSKFADGVTVYKAIKKGNIILNDPRMCKYDIFCKFVKRLEGRGTIKLILFENNAEQCIINAASYGKASAEFIRNMSRTYNLDNYKDYDCEIIKVFNNS